jgi:RNA-directed DNA polymerase
MKEPYGEGLALHPDPESCACRREAAGEALTGAHAGPVLSREIGLDFGVPTYSVCAEGNIGDAAMRKAPPDPSRSETRIMHGTPLDGNWEIPRGTRG